MIQRLNFNNPRRGKQSRAAFYIRWSRMLRRKRVAYARIHAWQTLEQAKRQIAKFENLARRHDVPIGQIPPVPELPLMPGREWVECLQDMGELKEPVKAPPPINGVPA